MNDLMDRLDERLFELGGEMEYALVEFRKMVGPYGVVAWRREKAPFPKKPYATHRVYFREDEVILESGNYELDYDEAIADAKARMR